MKNLKYILIVMLLLISGDAWAQTILSGKVTEEYDGKLDGLIGVNVTIVNSQNRTLTGVITDAEGAYNLRIPSDEKNMTVVFSYIGMKTERVKYSGQRTLNMTMVSDATTLDNVEVVAQRIERNTMGISQKEQVSATQRVQMDDLTATAPVFTVEEALQGQLGGVDIITGGGDPGAKSSIRIRGTSSLNSSSEPLIVIDGVPYSNEIDDDFDFATANDEDLGALLNIAPTDIQSIEVLKDAAATAIWGTKGANGVLMITTKRGSVGKTNFSFSSKFTTRIEPASIPMLNGKEYTALMQEAIWNAANYKGIANAGSELELLYNNPEIGYSPNWQYFNEYNQDTDWLGLVRRTGLSWDNNFSMSGGGEKATYRFSAGYLTDEGTTIGTKTTRLNTSLAIDYQFSRKLKFGADFSFSETNTDNNYANVRSEAFGKMPNKSPYWIDPATGLVTDQYFSRQTGFEDAFNGKEGGDAKNYNPIAMAKESKNRTTKREEKVTFRYDYEILKGLYFRGWASMKIATTKARKFLPQVATGVAWTDKSANLSVDAQSESLSLQTENRFIFNRSFGVHNIIANAVFRTSQGTSSSNSGTTSGNPSEGLDDPILNGSLQGIGSGESESRSFSGILLGNYTLLDRYVIQGSVSMEGNSAMGKSERIGYFPAAGISWNMQNEPFLRSYSDWLSELKLRFSVGQSGNAPSGSSIYMGAFSSLGNYMDMPAVQPVRMQLDKLKWETSTEYNYGIDLGFFKHRLHFSFEYYRKSVKDLLQSKVSIPSSTGYGTIKAWNSGRLLNNGWEFRADGVILNKKDWKLNASINFSRNRNEITELPDNMAQENYTFGNGNYAILVEAGRPIGSFYGYRYKGVYQNTEATYARDAEGNIMNDVNGRPIVMKNGTATVYPGDAIYEDINHDGVINEYDIVYLGNANPLITGGGNVSLKWKQLTLSVSLHGRFGQKLINTTRMNNEAMYGKANQSKSVLRRWRNEGDQTEIPRALYNQGYNYLGSDRFVENSSYLRLKSVSLSYQFPKTLIRKWGFNNLSVFVTGYDLYTWTNYTGQDPEVAPSGSATGLTRDTATTPVSIRLAAGVNMNF